MKSNTKLILIFFILISLTASGQYARTDSLKYFYVLNEDTIWTIPDLTKYTGKFEKKRRQYHSVKTTNLNVKIDSISKKPKLIIDTTYRQKIYDYPLIKGFYDKGIKSGKWKFMFDYGTDYSFCHQLDYDYYLTFKKDSVIKEKKSPRITLRQASNKDSSYIKGYLELENLERINFECKKSKNECKYWKLKNLPFLSTKFDDFTSTLKRIENGDFNRKIYNNQRFILSKP